MKQIATHRLTFPQKIKITLFLAVIMIFAAEIRCSAQFESAQVGSAQSLLMSFSGEIVSGTAQLSWVMENETNSDYFVIERSGNGNSFDSVGAVSGLNNAHQSDYTFTDQNLLSGNNYYRLRQMTVDGYSKYSKIICLTNATIVTTQMKVYPNPAISTLTFSLNSTSGDEVTIQIYNLAGVRLSAQQWQLSAGLNQQSIAINSLQAGDYILKISNRQGSCHYVQMFAKI